MSIKVFFKQQFTFLVKKKNRYIFKGYITAVVGKLTHSFGIGGNYKDVFILLRIPPCQDNDYLVCVCACVFVFVFQGPGDKGGGGR